LAKTKYLDFIKKLLSRGEKISSEITDKLMEEFKISRGYARNLIWDFAKDKKIFSSYPLKFDSGQYGYSLTEGNNQYVSLLYHKPKLEGVYYKFLEERVISEYDIHKLSGALNVGKSRYYDLTKVINDLKYFFPYMGKVIVDNMNFYYYSIDESRAVNLAKEKIFNRRFDIRFIPSILNYLQRISLISAKPRYIRNDSPFIGVSVRQNLHFDSVAFTGIGNPNKEATVVVLDIKINERYTHYDFLGFRFRVETLIYSTKKYNQRVIPIIVASDIEFFKEIKEDTRFLVLELSNLFGSRVNELLEVMKLNHFKTMSDAINALEVIDNAGLANQFQNFLPFIFESLIGELLINYFQAIDYTYSFVERNKRYINSDNKSKEFDIWFENDTEILIVECKFYTKSKIVWEKYKNDKTTLRNSCGKYFFEEKYDFLTKDGVEKTIKTLFVSANGFHTSMIEEASNLSQLKKHPSLPFILTAEDLLDLCQNVNVGIKEHSNWLRKVFIKNKKEEQTS